MPMSFRMVRLLALIMASATPAASLRGQNVQASDKYGIRRLWSPSSVAESGRYGDRSPSISRNPVGSNLGFTIVFGKLAEYVSILMTLYKKQEAFLRQVLQDYEAKMQNLPELEQGLGRI